MQIKLSAATTAVISKDMPISFDPQNTALALASSAYVAVGQSVTGTGIAPGTTVASGGVTTVTNIVGAAPKYAGGAALGQITLTSGTVASVTVGQAVVGQGGVAASIPTGAYVASIDGSVVTLSEGLTAAIGTFKLTTTALARAPFTQAATSTGAGAFVTQATDGSILAKGATTITLASAQTLKKGQTVSTATAGELAVTTTVAADSTGVTVTLSEPTTADIAASTTVTFSTRNVAMSALNVKVVVGQDVSGTGVASGTTVTWASGVFVKLSKAVEADLSAETLTFSTKKLALSSALAAGVVTGQAVVGTGVDTTTTVASVSKEGIVLDKVLATDVASGTELTFTANNGQLTFTSTTVTLSEETVGPLAAAALRFSDPVTLVGANAGIVTDLTVYGEGVPADTVVAAISGSTLTLSNAATAAMGNTPLTFGVAGSNSVALGSTNAAVVDGQAVSGFGIPPGTKVSSGGGTNTLTLSAPTTAELVSFDQTGAASTIAGTTHGSSISLAAGVTTLTMSTTVHVRAGDVVTGTGVPAGTTVLNDFSGTAILVTAPSSGTVSAGAAITFYTATVTLGGATTPSSHAVSAGMAVSGAGVTAGTTVSEVIVAPWWSIGSTGDVTWTTYNAPIPAGSTTITFSEPMTSALVPGQAVTGTGIAGGSTVLYGNSNGLSFVLDRPTSATVAAGATLTLYERTLRLSQATEGATSTLSFKHVLNFEVIATEVTLGAATGVMVGQTVVAATGVAPGTTVAKLTGTSLTLSQPTTGVLSSATLSFLTDELTLNSGTDIATGMTVHGYGIAPGTTVKVRNTNVVTLSKSPTAPLDPNSPVTFRSWATGEDAPGGVWALGAADDVTSPTTIVQRMSLKGAAGLTGDARKLDTLLPPMDDPLCALAPTVATLLTTTKRVGTANYPKGPATVSSRVTTAGVAPSFDAPIAVVETVDVADVVDEVQSLVVRSDTDDIEGYFTMRFTANDDLYAAATGLTAGKRLTMASNVTAADMEYLLESLVLVGDLDVSRRALTVSDPPAGTPHHPGPIYGYVWSITFKSQRGDQPLFLVDPGTPATAADTGSWDVAWTDTSDADDFQPLQSSSGLSVAISETVKGVAPVTSVLVPNLAPGVTYASRVSARNANGYGPTTSNLAVAGVGGIDEHLYGVNNHGEGVVPLAAVSSTVPSSPALDSDSLAPLTASQLSLSFGAPLSNGAPVETYRVEWSRDASFGTSEVKAFRIYNRYPADTNGVFYLGYGGERTVPLVPDASAADVQAALGDLTTVSPVTVSRRTLAGPATGYGYAYTVTFANDVGPLVKSGFVCRNCVTTVGDTWIETGTTDLSAVLRSGDVLAVETISGANNATDGLTNVGKCYVTVSAQGAGVMDGTAYVVVEAGHECGLASNAGAGLYYENAQGLTVDPTDLHSVSANGTIVMYTEELGCGTTPLEYGSMELSASAATCASTVVGAPSSVQRLDLGTSKRTDGRGPELGTAWETGGSFRLQLGPELTSCLSYDATAAELEAALEALPSVVHDVSVTNVRYNTNATEARGYYPIPTGIVPTDNMGYDFSVRFYGDYPTGAWPFLKIPEK